MNSSGLVKSGLSCFYDTFVLSKLFALIKFNAKNHTFCRTK